MKPFSKQDSSAGPAPPAAAGGLADSQWHSLLKSAVALTQAAGNLDEALAGALDLVLEYSGWPLGHALMTEDGTNDAISTRVWRTDDPGRFETFQAASEALRLLAGEGLPGRIIAGASPAWISDVAQDDDFVRREAAAARGIQAAAGVPISGSSGVLGVLEFFTDRPAPVDARLLDLLSHVGTQLGVVVERLRQQAERRQVEEALRRSERDLAEAQRLAHIGSWTWDVGADHVVWSAELHRIYGLDNVAGPVSFDEYLARVHPEDRERVADAVQNAVATLQPYEHEYRIVWPDGNVRWVHAAGDVLDRDGDRPRRLGGFCHDITTQRDADERRRQAQDALTSHRRLLEGVARGEPLRTTLDALCREIELRFPGAYCSVLAATPGEGVLRHAAAPSLPEAFRAAIDGLPIDERAGACGRAAARLENIVVSDTLTDALTADFIALAEQHSLRSVWSHPLATASGELLGTFAVYRSEPHEPDAAEQQAVAAAGSIAAVAMERALTEQALTAAARVDPLTGLANRAAFLNELNYRLRRRDSRTAVLFCDLDRFKWINDSLGHPLGDKILVEVAWRLEAALDGRHLLARFGGDEFTVLADGLTDIELDTLATGLEAALDPPFHLEGGEFFLSVSIGIATDAFATDAFELVRDADAAMYAAKERGRARHATFDSALRQRALERVTTEADLRRAVERDELLMHYQPIYRLNGGDELVGIEALVRWQHPSRGLVSPDHFIPLAEETGLVIPLGERILDRVLTEAAAVLRGRRLDVGINVSVVQLSDPSFPETLAAALDRHGVEAGQVLIEVTETAVMQELDIARVALEELVKIGARVLIDDFGTGYSSIARLSDLPVAGVKIDRRFSVRLGENERVDQLLAAITDLAHAMQLEVIVEGIETAAARTRAEELGCEFGQGYELARPAPLSTLFG
jgi:diguanylate cyclase (GGDEF)-like protein